MHKHQEKAFKCTHAGCDKKFLSKLNLSKHLATIHTTLLGKKLTNETYTCSFENCGKSFKCSSKLARHKYIHQTAKRFKCQHQNCNAQFSRKEHLNNHANFHVSTKRYKCIFKQCNSIFKYKENLQTHMKKHKDELDESSLTDLDEKHNSPLTVAEDLEKTPSQLFSIEQCTLVVGNQNIDSSDNESCLDTEADPIETTNNVKYMQFSSNGTKEHIIKINSDDDEYGTSSVVLENLSGSARTDYKSNHVMKRAKKFKRRNSENLTTTNYKFD